MEWTTSRACDYVAGMDLLNNEPLKAAEVGDGNLNFVFRVYSERTPERSLILKQAPPYIKILGPDYPLTQHRLAIEAAAMQLYHELLPGSVPEPLHYDPEAHLILMKDLRGYRILRDALIDGEIREGIAASVGAFMATAHWATRPQAATAQENRHPHDFHNPEMQAITADYVFTKPFQDDPTNWHTPGLESLAEDVRSDTRLLKEIWRLRGRFNGAQEGVVHGDLHTGSVMVKGEDARVIDCEFAFYGPIAFDVGALVANYLLAWYAHPSADRPPLMRCIEACWRSYGENFGQPERLEGIWREAIQFAGVKMLRRILGAAHVQDIESIADTAERRAVETRAITCGRSLVSDPPLAGDLPQTVARFA